MTNDVLTRTVGELVVEHPSRSRVFEQFDIDYCCGGKRRLSDACERAGASPDAVIEALDAADHIDRSDVANDWSNATISELIDHILSAHHAYLRRELPRLSEMAEKVVRAHGQRCPWVLDCQNVLADLRSELESHMMKEEQMLFPMIRALETATAVPSFHCGSLRNPITVMEHEHDSAGGALAKLRELSDGFKPGSSLRPTRATRFVPGCTGFPSWRPICTNTFTKRTTSCSRERRNENHSSPALSHNEFIKRERHER